MGTVFLAEDATKTKVAVKKIQCDNHKEVNRAMKEVWPIRALVHENLVLINDLYMEEGNNLCLVMEYFHEGDQSQFLKNRKQRGVPLSEQVVKSYFLQLASALCYLHQHKILHRDIKPENIFMCKEYSTVKIGDFGLARQIGKNLRKLQQEHKNVWSHGT
jgi:serine/threonine protein kinase